VLVRRSVSRAAACARRWLPSSPAECGAALPPPRTSDEPARSVTVADALGFNAQNERSWKLRCRTQTGGVTPTAQQPETNIVRVALQGFAAACGGTQSLHTNGFDEALALPTEHAAKIAMRSQQIIGYESGAADTVDPFAGSYYVEPLSGAIERRAAWVIDKVDELGGLIQAIEFIKTEIEESAFGYFERCRLEQDIVVGVNRFVDG
jgi:methylmalonyl-CoA mutase N-terminal domain/subunit